MNPGYEVCPRTESQGHAGLAWASRASWPLSTACPQGGCHSRLKSWLALGLGRLLPLNPRPECPPGGLVVAHGNLWMVGGWIGSVANLVECLLSTYCVSGVAIRRDEAVGFLGEETGPSQSLH